MTPPQPAEGTVRQPGSMEVRLIRSHDDRADPEPPFDLDRLRPKERELWDEYWADTSDGELVKVWSFGYACMLFLSGPPKVVSEWLAEHDPENLVLQYIENVRRARWGSL